MNGRYIGIGPKSHIGLSLVTLINCQHFNHIENVLGYIPLLQAGPTRATFLQKFTTLEAFFETIKAASTDIKQLNFMNMPKYTHINVSNTYQRT